MTLMEEQAVGTRDIKEVRGLGLLYTDWQVPRIERVLRDDVLGAVMDLDWQLFRESMKRRPTFDKMCMLESYWRVEKVKGDREKELARLRVINYLTALKRGGQLNLQGRIQR